MQRFKTNPYYIYDTEQGCWVCDTTEGNGDDFIGYESENAAKSRIELLNSIANTAWLGRRSGVAFFLQSDLYEQQFLNTDNARRYGYKKAVHCILQ